MHAITRLITPHPIPNHHPPKQVLEESPSVLLRPETRRAMQQQAAMLARAVKYRSVCVCICVYVCVCILYIYK